MRPSEILAAKADQIREVIARYPVRNPRVFGSAARGDDSEGSDLDILVEPLRGLTHFQLAGLELELRDLLGVEIDITTPGALRPELAERISRDLKPL
jgi:predicted nucleotidyltransferase